MVRPRIPEDPDLRKEIAKALRAERGHDRAIEQHAIIEFTRSRGAIEYVSSMKGLYHFFEYVRSLEKGKALVVDVGAGSTKASAQFQKLRDFSSGINFKATSLTRPPDIDKYLGRENLILTTAERLRGLPDGEVDGIISAYGILHSAAPELVAESLNRVLKPSGVLKITYGRLENGEDNRLLWENKLVRSLQKHHFDVATGEYLTKNIADQPMINTILVGIKAPLRSVEADQLLVADWHSADQQRQVLEDAGLTYSDDDIREARKKRSEATAKELLEKYPPIDPEEKN